MRFPDIRLVEQTEQEFRCIRVCLNLTENRKKIKKRMTVLVRFFYFMKAPTKNAQIPATILFSNF